MDWHARHPSCTTPRKLEPGEEKEHFEVYDEDDPTKVYRVNKARGELTATANGAGRKPPEYRPQMFGAEGDFGVVNKASHYDYTKKGGKFITKMIYADNTMEAMDGGDLTVANFDALTQAHSLRSVGTESLCAKSVKDYMSESHADAYESHVERLALEAKMLVEAQEKQRLANAAKKIEDSQAALEALYVGQRWGRIAKTKVGPWEEIPVNNQFTNEGTLLIDFKRSELDKSITSAMEMHESETSMQLKSGSDKSSVNESVNNMHNNSKGMGTGTVSMDDTSMVADFAKPKKKRPKIKIDPSITHYEDMKQMIGGEDKIEMLTEEWLKYSDVVRKKATKQKRFLDFTLDLFDACDRGQVAKVNAILATGKGDANMIINEEPLLMIIFAKAILRDQLFSTYTDDIPETGERKRMTGVLTALTTWGADINCLLASDGYAPIHLACITGNSKLLKWVLSKKGSMELYSRLDGMSPLMLAAKYGHIECMSVIMLSPEGGPRTLSMVDKDPTSGMTALHYAANYGQTHAAMFLLRIGADKVCQDVQGRHPGKLALDTGYFPTAQMILGYNAPFDLNSMMNSALNVGAKLFGSLADGAMNLGIFGNKNNNKNSNKNNSSDGLNKKSTNDDAIVSAKVSNIKSKISGSGGGGDNVRPFDED